MCGSLGLGLMLVRWLEQSKSVVETRSVQPRQKTSRTTTLMRLDTDTRKAK